MSLTQSDKNFWIDTLTEELNLRITEISMNNGDLIKQAREAAEKNLIDETGIAEMIKQREKFNKSATDHYDAYEKARKARDTVDQEITEILKDKANSRIYYNDWKPILRTHADNEMLSQLATMGDPGQQILNLYDAIKNLERSVRLATSNTALQNFLQQFSEKFSVNIGGVLD